METATFSSNMIGRPFVFEDDLDLDDNALYSALRKPYMCWFSGQSVSKLAKFTGMVGVALTSLVVRCVRRVGMPRCVPPSSRYLCYAKADYLPLQLPTMPPVEIGVVIDQIATNTSEPRSSAYAHSSSQRWSFGLTVSFRDGVTIGLINQA
jgi:hypothetical protein